MPILVSKRFYYIFIRGILAYANQGCYEFDVIYAMDSQLSGVITQEMIKEEEFSHGNQSLEYLEYRFFCFSVENQLVFIQFQGFLPGICLKIGQSSSMN